MDEPIVPVNQIASTSSELPDLNEAEGIEKEQNSVEGVEKQMDDLKLDNQFNRNDLPVIFKTFFDNPMFFVKSISLILTDSYCLLEFVDTWTDYDCDIRVEKQNDDWTVTYKDVNTTIKTVDPEKSIVDHLCFVLTDEETKLEKLHISIYGHPGAENRQKLNTLLPLTIDTIKRQFHIEKIFCSGLNEDAFLSLLKHVTPETLEEIKVFIGWKERGNYQKMEEIVGTDQWKQAKEIDSYGHGVFKLRDLLHCEVFTATIDTITPDEAFDARELFMNSANNKDWMMYFENKLNMVPFERVLSRILNGTNPHIIEGDDYFIFNFDLPNTDRLSIDLYEYNIRIRKVPESEI